MIYSCLHCEHWRETLQTEPVPLYLCGHPDHPGKFTQVCPDFYREPGSMDCIDGDEQLRTIIAGSRSITNYGVLVRAMARINWAPSVIISGAANGADRLGEQYAKSAGIPVELYPADWDAHGKRAGFLRNEQMAKNAQALVALWDGESRGTKSMIELARKYGLRIHIETYKTIP